MEKEVLIVHDFEYSDLGFDGYEPPSILQAEGAWSKIPEPYRHMGSVEFAQKLVRESKVALSPGVGFGPGGEGHVRFALIENEHRIGQAITSLRGALPELRS